jgi:hypothetical protein
MRAISAAPEPTQGVVVVEPASGSVCPTTETLASISAPAAAESRAPKVTAEPCIPRVNTRGVWRGALASMSGSFVAEHGRHVLHRRPGQDAQVRAIDHDHR